MESLTKDLVRQALRSVSSPAGTTDIVTSEHLVWVSACDTYASIKLAWTPGAAKQELDAVAARTRAAVEKAAAGVGSRVDSYIVEFVDHAGTVVHTVRSGGMNAAGSQAGAAPEPKPSPGHAPIPGLRAAPAAAGPGSLPGVANIIAVGAGKGGVGKSTVALNLAVGLARKGHSVGLLDGDIYGPSMPTMMGLEGLEAVAREGRLEPFYAHGVKAMTMGMLVPPDQPLIWRGPMAHGAFKQIAEQTRWGELDYLIIDLPPGTGDVALTMAQLMKLSGAVLVCTPQKVAQDDASRAAGMFTKLGVEVLGVVENMSYFVGDDGKVYDLFGRGGAEVMAQRLGLPFLGSIPITMSLRVNSDKGDPTSNFTGSDRAGVQLRDSLEQMVTNVQSQLSLVRLRSGGAAPTLTIR